MSNTYLLALDQGTTSTRAIVFDKTGGIHGQYQVELPQFFPKEGWVEHDVSQIWQASVRVMREALAKAGISAKDLAGMGISNQRETTIVWDKESGEAIYPAIVWQDRRTSDLCAELKNEPGVEAMVAQKTGLLLDPYFSATKIAWILRHLPGAKEAALIGKLLFGTVESYLHWKLTEGKHHYQDATNASRTLLFNIHTQDWDDELLALFDIPRAMLPQVVDNIGDLGVTRVLGDPIRITGMAGDQQAATVGQVCFQRGMMKSTYGTGCFILLNTGATAIHSHHQLLTTVAYRIHGKVTYGLEGSIFMAGATIQWLRDQLLFFRSARDSEALCRQVKDTAGVYLVPAFTGLGAPYWDPKARGALLGMTRDTQIAHIVRAAIEAVCYQTQDLMLAMQKDGAGVLDTLRVDGGMAANDWFLQFLADILNAKVDRPGCIETTALGAAYLAGLGAGVYDSLEEVSHYWHLYSEFIPSMLEERRETLYQGWLQAVERIRTPATAVELIV